MREMTTVDALEAALAASSGRAVFLFKHSLVCPVAGTAWEQVQIFRKTSPENCPEVHWVEVRQARPVSNAIADLLGVTHESPQLILVKNRAALWSASHGSISVEAIGAALAEHL